MESTAKLISSANRHNYPLSLIIIDVDHFKRINDRYGHPTGDKVLQTLTTLYKTELREADIFARFGGEEFIIALPHTDTQGAQLVAERSRTKVMNHAIEVDGGSFSITVSCGISQYRANETSIEDAIKRADEALYEAPEAIERWQRERYPTIARQARRENADVFFWDESGFRADAVHGKTWGVRGQTPVVERPGQRQSISAASAVSAKGGFWFCTYAGALNAELFVVLLRKMMRHRRRPVRLVLDGLPAHKKACVRAYVESTKGKLTLHFLPGYAPDLYPDELVWSHVKRTGVARRPLQKGEKLEEKINEQLFEIESQPDLVRSFFDAPSVVYIRDC